MLVVFLYAKENYTDDIENDLFRVQTRMNLLSKSYLFENSFYPNTCIKYIYKKNICT